jgi:hypothetical protein
VEVKKGHLAVGFGPCRRYASLESSYVTGGQG